MSGQETVPKSEYDALRAENAELRETLSELKAMLIEQRESNAELRALVKGLQQQLFGKKSEKLPPMPTVEKQLRQKDAAQSAARAQERRQANAQLRGQLPEVREEVPVPENQAVCPECGSDTLRKVGEGKLTTEYEYLPARMVRKVYVQETLACDCGEYIVTAPAPLRVAEGGQYGPGFVAHVITSKCADSLPLHRQEKQFRRLGIPVARATMVDYFHRAAELLEPLSDRLLEVVAHSDIVQADETVLKVQDKGKARTGYLWCFLHDNLIAYRFSPSRSGRTPVEVLGGGQGTLVVDGYSGYNRVFTPEGWSRAGCLAHVRRKFYEALDSAPEEARRAMGLILDIYRVEHLAKEMGIVGTRKHLQLRQTKSRPAMDRLHEWLVAQEGLHPPKTPLGKAISHALKNWGALAEFLKSSKIPVDNNASERALRIAAVGRKNFLFCGHDAGARNLAGLYSLVMTCEANGVNPQQYLADVLLRVQTHPASAIDELLPHKWRPPNDAANDN